MPKFALLLIMAILTDAKVNNPRTDTVKRIASIVYSEKAMEYESGQPVFSSNVEAMLLHRSNQDGVRVIINDVFEDTFDSNVIELNDIVELSEGTYTVVIESGNEEETFAFTIR